MFSVDVFSVTCAEVEALKNNLTVAELGTLFQKFAEAEKGLSFVLRATVRPVCVRATVCRTRCRVQR